MDRLLSAVLLIPGLPLILLLALIVRLTSKGPGLFKQVRSGRFGKPFTMYKLRTMRLDAETGNSGPLWARINDPRTTSFGRWLRVTHLDELPQLFNVLKGEMSLIGPRPERPEFVALLVKRIPNYRQRVDVLPGITGLSQINLPPDSDLESVQRKLFLDRAYIRTANFWLDVRILICTAATLIGIDGEWSSGILKLRRSVPRYPTGTNVLVSPGNTDQSAGDNSNKEELDTAPAEVNSVSPVGSSLNRQLASPPKS